jgi:hypothetical protein
MCIGSKVPPKIPVRTLASIGAGRGHQTEGAGDVGVAAAELCFRIDVLAVDSGGEVHALLAMWRAGRPHHIPPFHLITGDNRHLGQV